jgi:hypothetical protein
MADFLNEPGNQVPGQPSHNSPSLRTMVAVSVVGGVILFLGLNGGAGDGLMLGDTAAMACRWVGALIVACSAVGIVSVRGPVAGDLVADDGLPLELAMPYPLKVSILSGTQREILDRVTVQGQVAISELNRTTGIPVSELHHRIGQMRLLGLVEIEASIHHASTCRLHPPCAEHLQERRATRQSEPECEQAKAL